MRPREEPSRELLALAQLQAGVLTSAQVQAGGLGRPALRRLIAAGHWQRLDRAVYLVHPGDPGWLGWAWAGLLLAGSGARLMGTSAGYLHGLVEEPPRRVAILTPFGEVFRSRQHWSFRRERPGVRDPRAIGSPPRTTVEDTVLDLCDAGTARAAIGWVTAAVQERRTTVERLHRRLDGRSRARHRRLLTDLLADVAAGAESPLEVRYLRDVERAHQLPAGERQQRAVQDPYVRDVVYRHFATVAELDGRLGHDGMNRFRDMARDNRTAVRGELTLRYGLADVATEACSVAQQVSTVLRQRGWEGTLVRCPHCPPETAWTNGD